MIWKSGIHEVNLEILNKGMYKNGERLRKMALEFPYLDWKKKKLEDDLILRL